jgi:hypothetical protein
VKWMGDPADRTANGLVIGSAVVMLATFCYAVFVPARSAKDVAAGRQRSRATVEKDIVTAKQSVRDADTAIRARVWNGDTESVTAALLDRWTREAKSLGLVMVSFRPQKTRTVAGLTELPVTLQISGNWPRVSALLDRADKPGSRAVVKGVQVASADAASDAVTATLQFHVYLNPTKTTSPVSKAKVVSNGGTPWQR